MKDRTDPTNRDTVPAMLTPGEFVVNKEATQMYADQLKAMNNSGLALRAKRNGVPGFNEGGIALSDKEKEAMKVIALGESVGENDLGQAAVLWTMLNRGQRFNKKQTDWKVKDFETLKNKRKLSDYKKQEVNKISSILDDILAGKIKDPTGGASHYYANKGDNKIPPPKWARTSEKDNEASRYDGVGDGIQIGNHFFTGDIGKDYAPSVSVIPRVMVISKPQSVPEVTNVEPVGSDLFSSYGNATTKLFETIGKGEAMKGKVIPGYNEGGMPMKDDDIMNFIKTYQGNLGDVDPENVAASIISDEELLQNSSDVGANSFAEAGLQQFNNPRLSVPIPGANYGMTDSAQLRGGNVRPDMMPPGYMPPVVEAILRSTSPQGGMDRIAMANLKQAELDTPFPTAQMLDTQMFKESLRPEAINAPPIAKKEPFFNLSNAYNAAGEEIILDQEGGNKENITIPVTQSKFADQADAIKVNQAELEKAEAERLLRLATTEKARLDAIRRIETAQKKLDKAKGVVSNNITARENLNTIEDRNTFRNAELELASLRKEKANATSQLHTDQLDKLIAEKESLLKDVKTELGIDETNDNEIKKKTEVLTSRVPIPINLEEAVQSGKVVKAGSTVEQDSPQWESAKNFLKDIFGDIFNKKDLVRAITIYLGARIFGASGNQAGAMAGKYYLGKQDAHEATVEAYAKSGKYTSDSVALYSKTRNLADLVAIGKPVTPMGDFKMHYGVTKDGNTVRVNAQKFRMGEGNYVWKRKTKDGWVSFDVENYTADGSSNPNFDRDAYEQRFDRLYDQAKDLAKGNLTYIDEDDKEQKYFENLSEADMAQDLAKWAIDNDVDIGTAGDALKMAINMAKQAERKTGNTSDLTPFLNQAYIVAETNPSGESAVAFKNLKGEYIPYGDLKDAITNVATKASETNPSIGDMNPVLRQTAIIKIASRLYKDYATARATDGATDIYVDAAKNNDTTPLYEFMRAYR